MKHPELNYYNIQDKLTSVLHLVLWPSALVLSFQAEAEHSEQACVIMAQLWLGASTSIKDYPFTVCSACRVTFCIIASFNFCPNYVLLCCTMSACL